MVRKCGNQLELLRYLDFEDVSQGKGGHGQMALPYLIINFPIRGVKAPVRLEIFRVVYPNHSTSP